MARGLSRSIIAIAVCTAALLAAVGAAARSAGSIAIAVSPGARTDQIYDVRVTGAGPGRAVAALFVDYSGCAHSYRDERRRAGRASQSWSVRGGFTELSGWRSSSAGVDHACAYLVADGRQLASAQRSFRVR